MREFISRLLEEDLWSYLARAEKRIFLYGMGNGADKVLAVCRARGIAVEGVFASDGFVRGQSFQSMRVLRWSDVKSRYGAEQVIVLLSFATTLPDVMENVRQIAAEAELYVPDVPAFGEGLFDAVYVREHRKELEETAALFADERSREVFWRVVAFRLSGRLEHLYAAWDPQEETVRALIRPATLRRALDLGAYNGDSVRRLISDIEAAGGVPERVWAMEPDARTFRKLEAYAAGETRAEVLPVCAAAWARDEALSFDGSGNRNSSVGENRSQVLSDRPMRIRTVEGRAPDGVLAGACVDYIKYDVEGSELPALEGSYQTIEHGHPLLAVSLYHRVEDLWRLPLYIKRTHSAYQRFYLRLPPGIPAWDLMLYCGV